MFRRLLTRPRVVPLVLCLNVLPLLLFPASAYSAKTQEWWLPALLSFLTVLALIQILIRRNQAAWPWYMLSFAQGLNIISRLMMYLPHAFLIVDGVQRLHTAYVTLSALAIVLSAGALWYCELPEVRGRVHARAEAPKAG